MTQSPRYRDSKTPTADRVRDLLARMTLDEKLAQLGSAWVFELLTGMAFDNAKADKHMAHGIGQITRVAGASSLKPQDSAALANTIQRYLIENTRLGIPALVHEECCSGYMARDATCFPQIIGVASTWDPDSAEKMAAVVRHQMRAAGAQQGLSPVIDVTRDPRWGRVEETFGEDPYLVASMGTAFVRGMQTDDWRDGVLATAKHFVGYGLPEGGMNWAPVHIAPRELRETYMLPFEAAVKEANLQSVMNAYHELDGVPCAASKELFTDILRDEWGFDGIVVSDYFAVEELIRAHQLTDDAGDAAVLALEAGIDIELPSTAYYGEPLKQAIEDGRIDMALIDRSVGRLLTYKFEFGLFENPYVDPALAVFDTPEERALARQIADKSLVLLKNDADLLPLPKETRSIAVIGPNADTTRNLVGDYAYICHIETLIEMRDKGNDFDVHVPDGIDDIDQFVTRVSILDAIKATVSAETTVHHAPGCNVNDDDTSGIAAAVELAEKSDVAVLVLGGKSGLTDDCTCGEARDRTDLSLTGVQQQLLEAVHATGTPVVLVLVNGRPLAVEWAADHVPAILEAWLPGEEGAAAVAGALFGDVNPGGKLPITFPRHVGQVPIFASHKASGGKSHWKGAYVDCSNTPLWPLGHGLSYTTFELSNLRLDRQTVHVGETVHIALDVTNTGQRTGDEVVQLYIRDAIASVTRPVKELKGFKRLTLQPGERKTVTFALDVNQLGFYNRKMAYILETGTIDIMIGASSAELPLTASFEIVGADTPVEKTFFSQVHVSESAD